MALRHRDRRIGPVDELTRAARLMAVERLSAMAAELDKISGWLDQQGEHHNEADKASVLLECASRDLLAACWLVKPPDHSRPESWLVRSSGHPAG